MHCFCHSLPHALLDPIDIKLLLISYKKNNNTFTPFSYRFLLLSFPLTSRGGGAYVCVSVFWRQSKSNVLWFFFPQ